MVEGAEAGGAVVASEGAGAFGAPQPKVKPPGAGGAVALPNPVLKGFGGAAAGAGDPVRPLKPENGFGLAGASLPPVRPVKPPKGFEDDAAAAAAAAGGAASGAFAALPNFFRETEIILRRKG